MAAVSSKCRGRPRVMPSAATSWTRCSTSPPVASKNCSSCRSRYGRPPDAVDARFMHGQRVVLATGNPGKLRQFSELLGQSGLCLVCQSDFGIEPPPETGNTFLENSLIKARNAARRAGLPAIADDSGLEVDALDGRPGLYSARYAGIGASDQANLLKMLAELAGVAPERRAARYRS